MSALLLLYLVTFMASSNSNVLMTFNGFEHRASIREHNQNTRTMMAVWKGKKTSRERRYAGHVARAMHRMNSGSAVTYARHGSTGSALRLLLPGPSTLSSTNAHLVLIPRKHAWVHDKPYLRICTGRNLQVFLEPVKHFRCCL